MSGNLPEKRTGILQEEAKTEILADDGFEAVAKMMESKEGKE